MPRTSTPAPVGLVDDGLELRGVGELDGGEQADAGSNVGDRWVIGQRRNRIGENRLEVAHTLDESLALDHLEVCEPHRAGRGVAGVGVAVPEHVLRAGRPENGSATRRDAITPPSGM